VEKGRKVRRFFSPCREGGLAVKAEAMDMEQQVEHRHIPIRGLNLHVAQAGKGEQRLVVFLLAF
jgi:hypothetical protein